MVAAQTDIVSPLVRLRRLAAAPPATPAPPEQCELCGAALAPTHQHLLEIRHARLVCACRACGLLFANRGGAAAYLAVPEELTRLTDLSLPEELWRSMMVPIDLAFIVRRDEAIAAYYPSPAGATEAGVHPEAWQMLVERNPVLGQLRPHVEALLVNRMFHQSHYFRAPIDLCYQLVGIVRVHWRGLSGGTEVWKQVQSYFADLETRARPVMAGVRQDARHD